MRDMNKTAYCPPESELFEVRLETNILSIEGGTVKPFGAPKIGGFDDGEEDVL